jgi:hypothetical protein
MAATSRFRAQAKEPNDHTARNITIDHVRYKTEEGESHISPLETKTRQLKKSLTSRKEAGMSL